MFDAILCNPKDVVYPWSNWRINKDRHLFNEVIIVMTQSGDVDYTEYIKRNVDAKVIEQYDDDGKDWRNAAINRAIKSTEGDVLFLEQDFLYKDGFMERLLMEDMEGYNTVGFRDGNRFHPACLAVKRDVLYRTQRDFSVTKDVGDHFYKFTTELEALGGWKSLDETQDWYHLSGLTHNYRLNENWHHPEAFNTYNKLSQTLPQSDSWKKVCEAKEKQMGHIGDSELVKEFYET